MSFSYRNLWILLEQNGISKTDLRKMTGISTATLAKLSADQPVSMEVLGSICEKLGCLLGDVVSYEAESHKPTAWKRIDPAQTYLLKIYFHISDQEKLAEYLYGVVVPFEMSETGMDIWSLERSKTNRAFLILNGYLKGADLLTCISMILEKKQIGTILDKLSLRINTKESEPWIETVLRAGQFCNGTCVYRPPYYQPASENVMGMRQSAIPLQSFSDEDMYCESLFGLEKESIFKRKSDTDIHLMKAVWQFFKQELPLHGSLNEMARLNNFEVLTPVNEKRGIHFEIKTHHNKENGVTVQDYVEVRIDHEKLRGRFSINIRLANTANVFCDELKTVSCLQDDFVWKRPLSESASSVEISVWQLAEAGNTSVLIFHRKSYLVRNIYFNLRYLTRHFKIEDEWSRRLKAEKIQPDDEIKYYSSENRTIKDAGAEPWTAAERQIQNAYQAVLGETGLPLQGAFFPRGTDKMTEVLSFLKKRLRISDVQRVILIDPYIEAASITRFLRCIDENGISYEIYTDRYAHENKVKKATRIPEIQNLKEQIEFLLPADFVVKACTKSGGALHDRYLILVGEAQNPEVYMLSNSLDGMANIHSSTIMQLTPSLARDVFEDNVELIRSLQENGQIEVLYESKHVRSNLSEDVSPEPILPFEASYKQFVSHFDSDLEHALISLAYMHSETKEKCKVYILSQDTEKTAGRLIQILWNFAKKNFLQNQHDKMNQPLAIAQLAGNNFSQEMLEQTARLWEYGAELHSFGDYEVYYAVQFLWKIDPKSYCKLFQELVRNKSEFLTFPANRKCLVIRELVYNLIMQLKYYEDLNKNKTLLLTSELSFLRCIGIIAVLNSSDSDYDNIMKDQNESPQYQVSEKLNDLKQLVHETERLDSMIQLTESLQVIACRKNHRDEKLQNEIDEVCSAIGSSINTKKMTPDYLYNHLKKLYSRNPEDIAKCILVAWKKKGIEKNEATDLLIHLCLEKYQNGLSDSRMYYSQQDLEAGSRLIRYIPKIDITALSKLKKRLAKMERELAKRLYQPFLKTLNHSLWKASVDLYICLIYMEYEIASTYPDYPIQAVAAAEYQKIMKNFEDVLEKYSDVYQKVHSLHF